MGNKTCALWFVLLIGSVLAPSGAGWSQDAHIGGPVLMVAVYDDAGVGHEIVQRAEAQAGRLFGEAGVAVSWRNPRWPLPFCRGYEPVLPNPPTRLVVTPTSPDSIGSIS